MVISDLFTQPRVTGLLFILAFIAFATGAILPVVGEKGNAGIYNLPVREQLPVVAANASTWRWANILMGVAILILLAGLSILTTLLEGANERVFSRLGLVGFLIAALLWVIFSAFRAVITVIAAREMNLTGVVPVYYVPLAKFGFALFYSSAILGFLALSAYAEALLQVGLVEAWAAWAMLLFSLAMLALQLVVGDTLPAFHYVPPLLLGTLLVLHG